MESVRVLPTEDYIPGPGATFANKLVGEPWLVVLSLDDWFYVNSKSAALECLFGELRHEQLKLW